MQKSRETWKTDRKKEWERLMGKKEWERKKKWKRHFFMELKLILLNLYVKLKRPMQQHFIGFCLDRPNKEN